MNPYAPILSRIDAQAERMRDLVAGWVNINTNTRNLDGLARMAAVLQQHLTNLGITVKQVPLPPEQIVDSRGNVISVPLGRALHAVVRPQAPLRVFLNIHTDTVYPADDAFQVAELLDANTLRGPGVIDAKGGLAVMLIALEAIEGSTVAANIGCEIFINPDEEIGSPGSASFFAAAAKRNHLGLLFEPAMPDGALVAERKGSGNFSLVVRGRSAHAGRDFSAGRNAVLAAADFAIRVNQINATLPDVTVNVAKIEGGGPPNVVPDLAVLRLNARVARREDQEKVELELNAAAHEIATRHGVSGTLHGHFASPPKQLDAPTRVLCAHIESCGKELGIPVSWRPSGGASDGNKLAAAGLPVIDTLGPRGAKLHSPEEFLLLDSLTERAKLVTLLLLRLATGELPWPPKSA